MTFLSFFTFTVPSIRCRSIICTNCFKHHNPESRCSVSPGNLKCSICDLKGHSDETCTNNWRFFHSVTDMSNLNDYKAPVVKYSRVCVRCGSQRHSAFVSFINFLNSLARSIDLIYFSTPAMSFIQEYHSFLQSNAKI